MNVGKYVLKAFWECKKLFLNKNLLKQISAEAQSQVKEFNDEGDSDDECSSSEEEEPPKPVKKSEPDRFDVVQDDGLGYAGRNRIS